MTRKRNRILSLLLTFAMILSLITVPVSAKAPTTVPATMDDIVTTMEGVIDGESAFNYLSHVYLGWRTTGGPWQNYLIKDYIGGTMKGAGYERSDADLTAANDKGAGKDFFYVQKDASTSNVWAPEYARLQITSVTDGSGAPVDATAAAETFNVESYSFDPTSEVYQAHFNEVYTLGATVGDTTDFVYKMGEWITETDSSGNRVHVFPKGEHVGAARGEEAQLNLRAHLVRDTGFNATAEEIAAIRTTPKDVATLLAGKTGQVVYVANASGYTGELSALAGKVILTDSSNSAGFTLAEKAGAIGVMTTAALDKNGVNTPKETGVWYGGVGYDGSDPLTKWYSDSARFAGGAGSARNKAAMDAGKPIVEWNLSLQQYAAIKGLLDEGNAVEVNVATLGSIYPMNQAPAEGQLTAIAEIYGSKYPDERVVIAAHVQEPGSNDNATGVALNMELAVKLKEMIDDGTLPRPERTITFIWGDEMKFSDLYLQAHPNQVPNIVGSIDLDMVGEDPAKTGGPMRIEKAPDPSAYLNYTLDVLPGEAPYYDGSFADGDGNFVRLPDSHTLWGAGNPAAYDLGGVYMNDLYLSAANTVSELRQTQDTPGWPEFEVDVCPYEGGSDHTKFLARKVPTVLTWHFTDYTYHTTVDTLYMSSAYEMEDVGITSLAAAYHLANPTPDLTTEIIETLVQAAEDRFALEKTNTENHLTYATDKFKDKTAALTAEVEALNAWGKWYKEAVKTATKYYKSSTAANAAIAMALTEIGTYQQGALRYANATFNGGVDVGTPTLSLDKTSFSIATSNETMTASLAVNTMEAGVTDWDATQWTNWAKSLSWHLTREGSEQDPALYPNVYTGDALNKWRTWDDKKDYFTVSAVKVLDEPTTGVDAPNTKYIELTFKTGSFFGTDRTSSYRNVFGSFIGSYELSARDVSGVLAKTPLYVNIYDSYVRLDEEREKLEELKAFIADPANKITDRYLEIVDYGVSEDGYPLYYAILSDSAASVAEFKTMNEQAITNPKALQAQIADGMMGGADYRVPFFMNNVHADETPGRPSQINLLEEMVKEDTITYNTITGLKPGVDKITAFDPKVLAIEGFNGYGSPKYTAGSNGKVRHNTGVNDASELYTISGDLTYQVDDVLDDMIFLACISENPDGSTYNSRRNGNGFDLNRDASNQTQAETAGLWPEMSKWNPVVIAELHGFMTQFLVEPCTPPHEPNLEYDLLVENFLLGAEAYGNAALGTMSKNGGEDGTSDTKFWSYYTPLRDDFDPKTTTWSAWDDLATNYGPSYLMLNSGTMGYTIETPYNNEASTKIFEAGMYGLIDYVMKNKDSIYTNQLEFFNRGLENIDAQEKMGMWYVDINNNQLADNTWRIPGENGKYFPEYWMIPVDSANQRDPADAHEMAEFLMRNGVMVSKLTADVTVGTVTYKTGDYVVDMHQAKRNYANAVLWQGADASNSGFPDLYSESVSNFPAMRGFDCVRIDAVGAFAGKTTGVTATSPTSQFSGVESKAVVIRNNGTDAIKAINALLDAGKTVGMITNGDHTGSFLVSYADYQTVAARFALVAVGVEKSPVAYPIAQPTLYLAGRYDAFSGNKVASGYYATWFADGYGYKDYRNVHNNGTSAQDVFIFGEKELDFKLTSDPAAADIIISSVGLNQGEKGAAAVAAVQNGTPYIAMGSSPLSYLKSTLLKDQLDFVSLGMESLHYVTYPTSSLITSSYVAAKDYTLYSVNCAAITKVPAGAQILIQGAATNSHIAGCCLTEDGKALDGRIEAFALKQGSLDMTVFGNSIVNRAHQKDDYNYATNAIYSKMMGSVRMELPGVESEPAPSGGGDIIGGGTGSGAAEEKVVVKNNDGSTTTTITNKQTGTATATTVYPSGAKAETVTTASGTITGSITIPAGDKTGTVVLPMKKPAPGMVLKAVAADGTMTILPWAAPVASGMKVRVSSSTKVALVDGSKGFGDIPGSHWAADAIQFTSSRELFLGTGSTSFSPSGTMSRGMLVTVIHRIAGKPATSGGATFSDVAAGDWYAAAVAWAASKGIDVGANGAFAPDENITREGLAQMLYSFAKAMEIDVTASTTALNAFPDASGVSANNTEAMRWAVATGIISGKDTGKLDPTGTATRAEVSTMIMRFLTNV